MRVRDGFITALGSIRAVNFQTQNAYWQKHKTLILKANKHYPKLVVVFEDYFLYASTATAQINSHMETPQLLGILQFLMDEEDIPYYAQAASLVKKRWSNDVLVWKQVLFPLSAGKYALHINVNGIQLKGPNVVDRHTRDAIRHAMHFYSFGGKYEHTP